MCMVTIFCYGTLKQWLSNHEAYCGDAFSIREATVRGRLYGLPSGIPVLEVPDEDILAIGTGDPLADARTQALIVPPSSILASSQWDTISGEVMVLGNPSVDLPPIDRLEGFIPDGVSLYQRVLVPARTSIGGVIAAWCHVGSSQLMRNAHRTGRTCWP
jgi:gamma-glutamylcyclotransferase (GGCT)/AIG2-like uncharacterized protein YtfP